MAGGFPRLLPKERHEKTSRIAVDAAPQRAPHRLRAKTKTLAPVRPNCGIEIEYRRKLEALVAEMHRSIEFWISAAYRANEPLIAQDDAMPASALRAAMRKLGLRWQRRFDAAAPLLAEYFATAAAKRSDATLRSILKRGGWSVEFRMTPAARDIIQATVNQNVALIKSISSQHFTQIEGLVMRSVQSGRDLGQLTKDMQEQFGVTHRRAAFIARSQNNMATASLTRARQIEVGITTAIWLHSSGGKTPRKSHVAFSGEKFDVAKGWFDPDAKVWTWPGILPGCRCVSRAVVPGFS